MTVRASSATIGVAVTDVPVPAAVVDASGRLAEANAAFAELIGRDVVGEAPAGLFEPTAWPSLQHLLGSARTARPVLVRLDGGDAVGRLVEVAVAPALDTGAIVVFATVQTPRPGIDEALARAAPDLLGHGVVVGDGTRVLHVSDAAAAIYGRPVEELLARGSLFDLFEATEQDRLTALVADRQAAGEPVPEHFETIVARPDGSLLPVELWVKAVVTGSRVRTYTLISDASEQRQRQRQLAYMATHDHLTGLPNRYLLLDRLQTVVHRFARRPVAATLSFIDLDDFKAVNDTHGHAVGDAVLRATADRLVQGARSCDTVARLGGDEFVVLCTEAAEHGDADAQAARLQAVLDPPIRGDGWSAEVQASIGTLRVEDGSVGPEALLARADLAMYEAKRDQD